MCMRAGRAPLTPTSGALPLEHVAAWRGMVCDWHAACGRRRRALVTRQRLVLEAVGHALCQRRPRSADLQVWLDALINTCHKLGERRGKRVGPDWRGAWALPLAEVWAAPGGRCRCGWDWARPRLEAPVAGLRRRRLAARCRRAADRSPSVRTRTRRARFSRTKNTPIHLHAHPHVSRKALLHRAAVVRRPAPAAPPAPAAWRCGLRWPPLQASVGRAHARQTAYRRWTQDGTRQSARNAAPRATGGQRQRHPLRTDTTSQHSPQAGERETYGTRQSADPPGAPQRRPIARSYACAPLTH